MAPRTRARARFALVFTTNPSAADIFREDEFEDDGLFLDGQERRVKRPSWDKECRGRILKIGTRSALGLLKVKADGTVDEQDLQQQGQQYVGSRYREILNSRQQTRREAVLQGMARAIGEYGPGAVPLLEPHRKVSRSPKPRNEEALLKLKEELDQLPCLKETAGDHRLTPGIDVFYNGAKLVLLSELHIDQPSKMCRAILRKLFPQPMLRSGLITLTGSRSTVKAPEDILAAAIGFVSSRTMNAITFNSEQLFRNFFFEESEEGRKRAAERSARLKALRAADATRPGGSPLVSPNSSSAPVPTVTPSSHSWSVGAAASSSVTTASHSLPGPSHSSVPPYSFHALNASSPDSSPDVSVHHFHPLESTSALRTAPALYAPDSSPISIQTPSPTPSLALDVSPDLHHLEISNATSLAAAISEGMHLSMALT